MMLWRLRARYLPLNLRYSPFFLTLTQFSALGISAKSTFIQSVTNKLFRVGLDEIKKMHLQLLLQPIISSSKKKRKNNQTVLTLVILLGIAIVLNIGFLRGVPKWLVTNDLHPGWACFDLWSYVHFKNLITLTDCKCYQGEAGAQRTRRELAGKRFLPASSALCQTQ